MLTRRRLTCGVIAVINILIGVQFSDATQIEQPAPPQAEEAAESEQIAGESTPGYLGVIADDRAERGRGVRLVDVLPDGPAARAGLLPGDLVTRIEDQDIRSVRDFLAVLSRRPAGARLSFRVARDGAVAETSVTLDHRPPPEVRRFAQFGPISRDVEVIGSGDATTAARPRRLGVLVVPVTEEMRRRLRLVDHRGAVVTRVAPGSPAEHAGLPISATIVAVNRDPVDGPLDLAKLIAAQDAGNSVILAYLIDGRMHECEVVLQDGVDRSAEETTPDAVVAGTENGTLTDDVERLQQRVREIQAIIRRLEARIESQSPE